MQLLQLNFMKRQIYFANIEKKYNLYIDKKKKIVIRLDGKGITGNKKINLLDIKNGSFTHSLKEVAKKISIKYKNSLVMCGMDELDCIFFDTEDFLQHFSTNKTEVISSIFGQEVAFNFYRLYKKEVIFKTIVFGLYEKNVWSYFIKRKHDRTNNLLIYLVKRYRPDYKFIGQKFEESDKWAKENIKFYENRENIQKEGIAFFNGKEFSFEEVLHEHDLIKLYEKKYGEFCEVDII